MEINTRKPQLPAIARTPVVTAPQPTSNVAVDTFERGVKQVVEPVTNLVQSADNEKQFNRVATEETSDVFAFRTSAHVAPTVKKVVESSKVAAAALKAKKAPTPAAGPKGFWGKLGVGLGILDIGAGAFQTTQGISELRVGKTRDGLVNVTGGAAFMASSALYLLGRSVAGPFAAAAACLIPGINAMVHGFQKDDTKQKISGGILAAGGVGYAAMGAMALTGVGAGVTVLGLPLLGALAVGVNAVLVGQAVHGNWATIKGFVSNMAKKISG